MITDNHNQWRREMDEGREPRFELADEQSQDPLDAAVAGLDAAVTAHGDLDMTPGRVLQEVLNEHARWMRDTAAAIATALRIFIEDGPAIEAIPPATSPIGDMTLVKINDCLESLRGAGPCARTTFRELVYDALQQVNACAPGPSPKVEAIPGNAELTAAPAIDSDSMDMLREAVTAICADAATNGSPSRNMAIFAELVVDVLEQIAERPTLDSKPGDVSD